MEILHQRHDRIQRKVVSYADGLTKDEFLAAPLTYDATMWNLRLIGEAATNVPPEVRNSHQHIHWAQIIGMRNRLTHGYLDVNENVVWTAIQIEVPKLLVDLRELTTQIDEGEDLDSASTSFRVTKGIH